MVLPQSAHDYTWSPTMQSFKFYFQINEKGITEAVIVLTIAQVKTVNICFITSQTFLTIIIKLQT